MEFGEIETADALGCILAHTVRMAPLTVKKGTVIDAETIANLTAAGLTTVIAARPEAGDVGEDEAAGRIAQIISGENVRVAAPFTGRSNLYALSAGLFTGDRDPITRLNRVDEAMTVATLPPFCRVSAGQMIATVKIIPFMVPEVKLAQLEDISKTEDIRLSVASFRPLSVNVIISQLPGDTEKIVDIRRNAITKRVSSLGGSVNNIVFCRHHTEDVAEKLKQVGQAGNTPILIFGASAIVDRGDVIPAALERAGGTITHLGMPVDPGNLLLYGKMGASDVVGVPSCAASIKENGFDWILERLFAGLSLDREAFVNMACGGLLKEIPTRPQPREAS